MALKRIGDLDPSLPLTGAELVELQQGSASTRCSVADIAALAGGGQTPVLTVTSTAHQISASESGSYLRFSASTAKTCLFRPESDEALPDGGQWEIRNAGAANLTLTSGSGVTLNPPYGGTLVVPTGGTVAVKRAATDVFDVMGVTV